MRKLQAVLDRFEISIAEVNDLVVLEDYDIVIIADDSGSMQRPAAPPEWRTLGVPCRTRWDELQETIAEIVEIASCFNPAGINVHFLNRAPVLHVKHAQDRGFQEAFASPPRGSTPLTETLQRVAQQTCTAGGVLLFILTDGEPNGGRGPFLATLRGLVSTMQLRVQVMACTAEDTAWATWLHALDNSLKEVHFTNDYHATRREVRRAHVAKRFTRGDWITKAMLGLVSQKFDLWDERLRQPNSSEVCQLCSIM
jgi:hypothetical protein